LPSAAAPAGCCIHDENIAALLLLPLAQQRLDAAAAAFEEQHITKLQQELLDMWQVWW
jgi:hypothetical protein